MLDGCARGLALTFGVFALMHLAIAALTGFNANRWWFDAHPLPRIPAAALLATAAVLLTAFAARPEASRPRRILTLGGAGVLLAVAVCNSAGFFVLLAQGRIASGLPVPFSLLLCGALAVVIVGIVRGRVATSRRGVAACGLTCAACLAGFPVAQIFLFGNTDYRRPADAIVVFGARAYADGRCSAALADRVRTACDLYHQGMAPTLLFSGGPGDGDVHETEAMRRLALSLRVPPERIVLDPDGITTAESVRSTCWMLDRMRARRVLAVSHFYHLPRIKMTYQRAGRDVFTVPARESYVLTRMPYYVAREVVCLWMYYLRALLPVQRSVVSAG